jgi:hypothetical protein
VLALLLLQVIAIDSFVNIEFDDELKVGIEGLTGGWTGAGSEDEPEPPPQAVIRISRAKLDDNRFIDL